jgi:hypothetical protein
VNKCHHNPRKTTSNSRVQKTHRGRHGRKTQGFICHCLLTSWESNMTKQPSRHYPPSHCPSNSLLISCLWYPGNAVFASLALCVGRKNIHTWELSDCSPCDVAMSLPHPRSLPSSWQPLTRRVFNPSLLNCMVTQPSTASQPHPRL